MYSNSQNPHIFANLDQRSQEKKCIAPYYLTSCEVCRTRPTENYEGHIKMAGNSLGSDSLGF